MSEYFTTSFGTIVAEVAAAGDTIYGTGRAEVPVLVVPLQLRLTCPKSLGCCVDFREIRCRVSPFDQTYIALSHSAPLKVRLEPDQVVTNHSAILEIPLDQVRLTVVNRLRNGGDVKLRLDFELLADEVVKVGLTKGQHPSAVWGLKDHYISRASLQVVIARSRWVDQVLAQTGFGKIHILELPKVPLESCAGVQKAFDALQTHTSWKPKAFTTTLSANVGWPSNLSLR